MSNPRGFNKGRYYGKNNWRGGYKTGNNFRGRGGFKSKASGQQPPQEPNSSLLTVNEEEVASHISKSPCISRPHRLNKISPYAGWELYFPDDEYKTSKTIICKVKAVEDFIARHGDLYNEEEIEGTRSCIFDLKIIFSDVEFSEKWPLFKEDLISDFVNSLNCLGLAIYQTIWKSIKEQSCAPENEVFQNIRLPMINARIINFDTITQLKDLKSNYCGKMVSIYGTVIRVSNVKLRCSWLAFQCVGCETIQCVKQLDGAFTQPTSCLDKDCRLRTFEPLRLSPYTQTFNWQTIRLQEMASDDQREGRVPRTIECELTEDDLVNSCTPGDIITVTGVVKARTAEENFKRNNGPNVFTLYLKAMGLLKNNNIGFSGQDFKESVQFVQKDYDAIHEIKSTPNLFKVLVHSLCPTIYGHEMVKAGLLLALFGGSQNDGIDSRGEAHVLVVGDPGLGKSQMLQACSFIAPRGVFVCGNTTTSSGLTVTLARDTGGDYTLEAGALVLADQGCCCIDEFDKMPSQHQALLEAMEQQTVSVAKAGVICKLPARTSVLAAANPVGGHYNKSKTVSENLRMGQALLSRFDLVFILLDQPNEQLDMLLSEHVMKLHSGISKKSNANVDEFVSNNLSSNRNGESLNERLKKKANEDLHLIPSQLLRKYIAYSRKFIPTITLLEDARSALQEFYFKIRENHHTLDSTPVTTRQLLSLIRLTQARAKLELREEATLSDALDVINIVESSLIDTFLDEYGTLDFTRSQNGSGLSKRNQAKRFLTMLHKRAEQLARSTFDFSEMKEIAKLAQIDVANFSSFVTTLNNQGYILKKGQHKYQILSAD